MPEQGKKRSDIKKSILSVDRGLIDLTQDTGSGHISILTDKYNDYH
jgi:hypothetical protein